jgi:hypothetical protein
MRKTLEALWNPVPHILKNINYRYLFPVLWIRIGFNADPDPELDDKKLEKVIFFDQKLQFNFLRPPYRTSKLQENSSYLKR